MFRLEKTLPVVLGGMIGAAAGVVVSSLVFSAYYAATGSLKWHDLSDIAGFWNGHLAIAGLFILGVGLYLQARAEREQVNRYRAEFLRSSLAMLTSRIGELEQHLRAYRVNSSVRPLEVLPFVGISEIAIAVSFILNNSAEEFEVWVERGPLRAYAQAAAQLTTIGNSLLESSPQELIPGDDLLWNRQICRYADEVRRADLQLIKDLEVAGAEASALRDIAEMLESGWRIERHSTHNRHYLNAQYLFPHLKRIEQIRAEGGTSVADVCGQLAVEWRTRWSSDAQWRKNA